MTPATHIELIREQLDKLADEHPVQQKCWLSYQKLLEAIEDFAHDLNKMELAQDEP